MKLTFAFAVTAALAISARAAPLRLITFTGESAAHAEQVQVFDFRPVKEAAAVASIQHSHKPCHGSSSSFAPLGALLSRLWSGRPSIESDVWAKSAVHADRMHHDSRREKWRLEAMMREAEGKNIPIFEGAAIRILPFVGEDANGRLAFSEKHIAISRHRSQKFITRLRHAVRNLTPLESAIMAFVIGVGLGCVAHAIFIIFFLIFRHFGFVSGSLSGSTCAERRAARREARCQRKEARRANKAAKAMGTIRLEGENNMSAISVIDEKQPGVAGSEAALFPTEKI